MHMHTVVEHEVELTLLLPPERSIPVPARLIYRADDPFAVQIVFHVGSDSPVRWTFARELLVEGVFRACGEGDVRVWPLRAEAGTVICMALTSPDGDAVLEAPAAPLSTWLERTLRAVPSGQEHEVLDLDGGLARLLAAAAADEAHPPGKTAPEESGE